MMIDAAAMQNEGLKKYVKMSIIFHVVVFLALSFQSILISTTEIDFSQAIRVDTVALPDKIMPAAPPAPTPEVAKPKEEPKTDPAPEPVTEKIKLPPKPKDIDLESINLDKTKKQQKSALEKLKQMEALEKIQNEIEKERLNKIAQAAKVKYKGNTLSPGTELTGVNKLQADTYIDDVHKHLIGNWALPEYLKNRNLKAEILVKFDESGNILEKSLVKSSGNQAFDDYVMTAVQKSSPVPPPPAKFVRISSIQGFLFRFSHDK